MPRERPSVLLVMRPGPARRAAAETLRGAGYRVRTAREPYEGTARFVERPTDLVVLSLDGFRRRDTAFLATVKKRTPSARVLLLVPEGHRQTALAALQAGADAYALEPFYPAELTALAGALLADRVEGPDDETPRALGRLAGEIAHAINNPLQILALVGESADVAEETRSALGAEIGRIQAVTRILARFGLLRRPQRSEEPLGQALRQSLETAAQAGRIELTGQPPEDGPPVSVDSSQAGVAFDSILQFLVARAPERPLRVTARVRAVPARRPEAVEAAVRGRDIQFERAQRDLVQEAVLLNRDDTREPYPGLALARAVAQGHGGQLLARATEQGLILGLRLPLRTRQPAS